MSDTDIKRVTLSFSQEELTEILERHVVALGFGTSDRFQIQICVSPPRIDIPEGVWAKVNKLPPI